MESMPPALGVQSLNRWTTKEVHHCVLREELAHVILVAEN